MALLEGPVPRANRKEFSENEIIQPVEVTLFSDSGLETTENDFPDIDFRFLLQSTTK